MIQWRTSNGRHDNDPASTKFFLLRKSFVILGAASLTMLLCVRLAGLAGTIVVGGVTSSILTSIIACSFSSFSISKAASTRVFSEF